MKKQAVVIKNQDNVATVLLDIKKGEEVNMFVGDKNITILATDAIPFGHKIAIKKIQNKERIIKYGESLGRATQNIEVGSHVHVHNVESERGRGDWE